MTGKAWEILLEERCNNVITAYSELTSHVDKLEHVTDTSPTQMHSIAVRATVMVSRVHQAIAQNN